MARQRTTSLPTPRTTTARAAAPWWGRWRRVRLRPAIWCGVSLALFIAGVALGWPELWLGVILAVPVMITSTGLGWAVALPLLPLGLLLGWLRDRAGGPPLRPLELAGLAAALLLAILAGNDLFRLWHRTARAAGDNERRARLLSESALAMQQAEDRDALFEAMPRLLADIFDVGHAEVFVPDGEGLRLQASHGTPLPAAFRVPAASVMGRALRTGQPQYVPDTSRDGAYLGHPGGPVSGSELALPLTVSGRAEAVLNLEHPAHGAFTEADQRTLEAFARIAEEVLARLGALAGLARHGAEQALVARLGQRLLLAEGAREATAAALTEVLPALGLDAGTVAVLRRGALHSLTVQGAIPQPLRAMLTDGLPLAGRLREVWETHRPVLIDDIRSEAAGELARLAEARAVAIQPITNARREMQALLLLSDQHRPRAWSDGDRRMLDIVATSLGVVLDRATVNRQLMAMLDVIAGLARAEEPHELYRRAAESAVRLIPGAEAATILVRGEGGFYFEAAVGYDLAALRRTGPFDDRDELAWYHAGADGFRRGLPRVARGADVRTFSAASGGERSTARSPAARVSEIVANVCVPITDSGEVVALLNVDSFSNEAAFGASARRLAEAFAQQVAVIKRQAEALGHLRRSVVTDPLTGLGNREGLHRRLDQELARANRYGHALSIVMLDLDTFKQVNDRFGHHAGDEALVQVARALAAAQRSSDAAFRWGGDEFVILLPEIGPREADAAAQRLVDAVASVEVQGLRLTASVGVARYPEDGADRGALMRRADELMYHRKPTPRRDAPPPGAADDATAAGYPSSSEPDPSSESGGGTVA